MVASLLTERVERLLARTTYAVASTADDMLTVGRLRYRAYREEGVIPPNPSRILLDEFDLDAHAATYVVSIDGEVAGSIRLHLLASSDVSSPALEVFPELIAQLVSRGKVLDPNRFVVDPSATRWPELAYVLLRIPFMASIHYDVKFATATVRKEHRAFYKRILQYDQAAEPRDYPTLLSKLSLMVADFQSGRDAVLERFPFFSSNVVERERLFGAEKFLAPCNSAYGLRKSLVSPLGSFTFEPNINVATAELSVE